ncbi:MAG: hypothetical protein ACTSRZ_04795 [Promethearchaeota archaeon]
MSKKSEVNEIKKVKGKPIPITCYGCSVLCDDIYVELDNSNSIIKTINSCFKGNDFLHLISDERRFSSPVQKQMGLTLNLSMDEAVETLQSMIDQAKSISFYGLGSISYNDQLIILKYIKELLKKGKKIILKNCSNLIYHSSKKGLFLTTIGQAANNADVFVYWNTDPTHSHPKLTAKILFSRGRFRSTGKEVKKLILIESEESDLTHLADVRILLKNKPESIQHFLNELEKLLTKDSIDLSSLKNFGIDEPVAKNLKKYLSAEYGIFVTTAPLNRNLSAEKLNFVKKFQDVLNLNARGKFMILLLSEMPNEIGLSHAVLTMFQADEIEKMMNLSQSNIPSDLGLVFGGEYLRDEYIKDRFEYPESNKILFDNYPSNYDKLFKFKIPYAIPGIEHEDIAFRLDGISVKLKKWSEPPEEVWPISKIFKKLK